MVKGGYLDMFDIKFKSIVFDIFVGFFGYCDYHTTSSRTMPSRRIDSISNQRELRFVVSKNSCYDLPLMDSDFQFDLLFILNFADEFNHVLCEVYGTASWVFLKDVFGKVSFTAF